MVKDQTADILGFLGRIYTVPVAYSFFPSPFNNVTSRPSSQAGHGAASCCSGQTPDSQECSQLWIRTKAPLVSCVPPAPSTWGGGLAAISSFYTDAWKPGCLWASWNLPCLPLSLCRGLGLRGNEKIGTKMSAQKPARKRRPPSPRHAGTLHLIIGTPSQRPTVTVTSCPRKAIASSVPLSQASYSKFKEMSHFP